MGATKLYFLVGLPASGKTTWARQKVKEEWELHQSNVIRINKDDIRAMIDLQFYAHNRGNRLGSFIRRTFFEMVQTAMQYGFPIILDNTHIFDYDSHRKMLDGLNEGVHNYYTIEEKFFPVDVEECIRRDSLRGLRVGEKVIRDMWREVQRNSARLLRLNVSLSKGDEV